MLTDHSRRPARPPGCLAVVVLVLGLLVGPGSAQAGLFGSNEVVNPDLSPFPRWTGVLDRVFREKGSVGGSCQSQEFNACHYGKWMQFLDSVRGADPRTQLKEVNKFMNRSRYIVDPVNWGVKDYWATVGQFLDKYGDCEDYAIAKYVSLRELGWSPDDMRIVIVQDMNLRVAHAILAVNLDGESYILDNQIGMLVKHSRIRHYRPIYSVSEKAWWRHLPQ
ncbi:transglutaminase-like cysteine peptidase [Roseospirillum parvum]|uniref:Transglutaminase-like cysteine proteinase BTLCP n=1 Tax=Roseospirillum parvum TaxID=83401 RepID=A0A1G7U0R4_9PROT|nr:transglutaminase-like cysteine peptidase [Roseospirillum parvum]SDG40924.1 transglutaminase-like cysteine proteinase BTLCP [Roseospirillum parvum]